jgi:archaemetzincin
VLLVTLGAAAPRLAAAAAEAVHEFLDLRSRPGPALDRPKYAFNKDRRQYHATSILRRLSTLRPRDGQVVGILDVDLFLPDAAYVIGDADRDAGAAIFSIHRLSQAEPDEVRRRVRAESVHAVGHLLGLSHCNDFRCAMFYSRDAADVDRKEPGLCASCRAALGLGPK